LKRKINWGMLLSHHPECQYDRTFAIGKARICVRCSGFVVGVVCVLLIPALRELPLWATWLLLLALPLPAIFNFTLHELGLTRNRNAWRLLTGLLLGAGVGLILVLEFHGRIWLGVAGMVWILLLEGAVAVVLHRRGQLERFFGEYENGVYKNGTE
jgi:uncharacterized membrane protein